MESQATSSKKSKSTPVKPLLITGVAVVVCGLSFYSGTVYQKSKAPAPDVQTSMNGDTPGNFSRGQRTTPSTVTAVTDASITIKTSSDEVKTYAITSSTQITKNRETAAASDITVGDSVLVVADTSDSATASRIIINPEANGPMMYNGGGQGPSTDVQTN